MWRFKRDCVTFDMCLVSIGAEPIVSVLSNARNARTNLSGGERAAFSDLKSDGSIVTLSADKGKGTVLLDWKDYDAKM